ncbi:MAG: LTA synthase family protein [Pseudorhodoplanes sp.]|nr:LTA synthase family protein [Pseudorhodoplanes sp.]
MLGGLSLSVPEQPWEPFQGNNHVSSFVRSGVLSASQLTTLGWIEADAGTGESLRKTADTACRAVGQRPNIIFILDESSFDVSRVPDMKVPAGYDRHFRSVDGKLRLLSVEGTGGPTWYTEYNVLTGLSARSFGKLSFYVTRIAAGRVERGLPQTLRRCGYKTFSLYPAPGSFLSARAFQHSAGVQRMIDSGEMRAGDVEPDHFYYDQALKVLERGDRKTPHFLFVYTVANHFPWDQPYRADLTPDWRAPGNGVEFDEYIRRQVMSAQDYRDFVAKLKSRFPGEPFLIVRFGDHQPYILEGHRAGPQLRGGVAKHHAARSALFHDLLRDRRRQLSSGGSLVGDGNAGRGLSSASGAGGRGPAARWLVPGTEENPAALRGCVLRLPGRRGGTALQSPLDRRRPAQGVLSAGGLPPRRAISLRRCGLRGANELAVVWNGGQP